MYLVQTSYDTMHQEIDSLITGAAKMADRYYENDNYNPVIYEIIVLGKDGEEFYLPQDDLREFERAMLRHIDSRIESEKEGDKERLSGREFEAKYRDYEKE